VVFAAKAFLYGAAMENKITGKESGEAIKRRREFFLGGDKVLTAIAPDYSDAHAVG
jgi:hypothetical protein